MQPDIAMVPVTLLEVPVAIWGAADDEGKDLMREFTLIVLNRERAEHDVPRRLLDLIEELGKSYGSLGQEQARRLEEARAQGEPVIDRLDYQLPAGATHDIENLATLMDDADEYCRQGQHLLSLASSPASKAFRDWIFDEFCSQIAGREPTPWPKSRYAASIREVVGE